MRIEVTLPVNDPARPEQPRLDRAQVWEGLLRKAENAVPFVAGMSQCTVLERRENGLLREVVVNGERLREEVTFEPPLLVSFLRRGDRDSWVIRNRIGEDSTGALTLTFIGDMPHLPSSGTQLAGGRSGEEVLEQMRARMLETVRNTLDVIRRTTPPPTHTATAEGDA
ncbi:SRPBCC family protein [Streptomyces sp. NPDC046261]|uniref:SRPBCC family protein n=1 Tax=Streptomyces sp. NPDC046261 TaxID=3157200 RepID=UPI0033F0651E